MALVYLVERSSVLETTLKHLVNDLARCCLVGAGFVGGDGFYGPAPDAFLVLASEADDSTVELAEITTVAAEVVCSNLCACDVAEVVPVDVEATFVVHVDEFVGHGALHMPATVKVVGAEDDAAASRDVSACHEALAGGADEVARWDFASRQRKVLQKEDNGRRIVEQPCLVCFAARNGLFVAFPDCFWVCRGRHQLAGPLPPTLETAAHRVKQQILHSHRFVFSFTTTTTANGSSSSVARASC